MKQMKATERRVAMSYEFEDLLNQLKSKKDISQQQTEPQRIAKLNKILSQSIESFKLNVEGNITTKYEFIEHELNVKTPNDIENCSIQIYDGINRLRDELDLIDTANAVIDLDSNDPSSLICNLKIKEKSRLTASIGASHDINGLSQLNGSLSVGVRNLFGNAERLDLSADLGLGTTNRAQFSNLLNRNNNNNVDNVTESTIYNLVSNTSNQYSISFSKPRVQLPFNIYPPFNELTDFELNKSTLILKVFQQSVDRVKSSSYNEQSFGTTSMLLSPNKNHCLLYNYHFRSLIPITRGGGGGSSGIVTNNDDIDSNNSNNISSAAIDDEYMKWGSVKSSIGYRYVSDTRNHQSIPSSGYLLNTDTEIGGIGGDVDFFKFLTSFYYHWSMPTITTNVDPPDVSKSFSFIFNCGIQTGFVMPWKKKLLGMNSKYGDINVRVLDRIIPIGGLQARGFENAQIGPKDNSDYVHADFLFAGGISICTPIFTWLYGNIFFNFCNCGLLNDRYNIKNNTVASTGISGIVPFPVGRLEIGYSFPLKTNNNPFNKLFWAFDVQFF